MSHPCHQWVTRYRTLLIHLVSRPCPLILPGVTPLCPQPMPLHILWVVLLRIHYQPLKCPLNILPVVQVHLDNGDHYPLNLFIKEVDHHNISMLQCNRLSPNIPCHQAHTKGVGPIHPKGRLRPEDIPIKANPTRIATHNHKGLHTLRHKEDRTLLRGHIHPRGRTLVAKGTHPLPSRIDNLTPLPLVGGTINNVDID